MTLHQREIAQNDAKTSNKALDVTVDHLVKIINFTSSFSDFPSDCFWQLPGINPGLWWWNKGDSKNPPARSTILKFWHFFHLFFLTIFMGDDYASSSVQKLKINIHVCVCKTVKKACISEIDSNICFYFLLKSAIIYLKST